MTVYRKIERFADIQSSKTPAHKEPDPELGHDFRMCRGLIVLLAEVFAEIEQKDLRSCGCLALFCVTSTALAPARAAAWTASLPA